MSLETQNQLLNHLLGVISHYKKHTDINWCEIFGVFEMVKVMHHHDFHEFIKQQKLLAIQQQEEQQ